MRDALAPARSDRVTAAEPGVRDAADASPDVVHDAVGTAHRRADGPVRIVSLVPSLTETLCEMGLAGSVVGRTGFCIHPRDAVRAIPKVGGTKSVDLDAVRALAPTHLLVNIDENERPAVEALSESVPHVVVTHPLDVADNHRLYRLLGHVFDRAQAAQALSAALSTAYAEAQAACAGRPVRRVLYAIWKDPWMTIAEDTYIARMLAAVALRAVASGVVDTGRQGDAARYPVFDLDAVRVAEVDALLLSSEPYRFGERHRRALDGDARLGGMPVRLIDGEMASWYGSRAVHGLRYLARFRQALDEAMSAQVRA